MDALLTNIHNLWTMTYDFLVVGVLGYLAKKWVADRVVERWNKWKNDTPRTLAIWEHYNHNHDQEDVLDCAEGNCTVFKNYAS